MGPLDYSILIIWIALTTGVGLVASFKIGLFEFWLNKKETSTLPLLATIVATQVGAGAIIGIAASTAGSGIGFGLVSLLSTVSGFVFIGYLAPKFKRLGDKLEAITLPKLFLLRYGRSAQLASSLVIVFVYLSLLAAQFYAVSSLIQAIDSSFVNIVVIASFIGVIVYSSLSGYKGDLATDIIHMIGMIFLIGLGYYLILSGNKNEIENIFSHKNLDPLKFGGWTFLILGTFFGFLVPLLTPEQLLRIFSSRSQQDARKVYYLSAFCVIPFYCFAILLGLISTGASIEGEDMSAQISKTLIDIFPKGFVGLAIGIMISVIVSTANTLIVVLSSTLLNDTLKINISNPANFRTIRLTSIILGSVALFFSFVSDDIVKLLLNTFYGLLTLLPAMTGVIWYRKASNLAATVSILLGFLVVSAFLFFMPEIAFLPALLVSCVTFYGISYFSQSTPDADLFFDK